MKVIHALQANLAKPGNEPVLHAMRYDGVRKITVQLYSDTAVWTVPAGVTAGIGYTLPNRQSGYYEKLSDGTAACTVEGNTVTAVLAPILTSAAGEVKVSIVFAKNSVQLSTFPFRIRVTERPGEVDSAVRPDAASPFVGKLYYGGDNGLAVPLTLGAGVRVEQQPDGSLMLVAEGGSDGGTSPAAVSQMISLHNVERYAHEDIRIDLRALADRFNAIANSEDIDLDQLAEIVAYIKSNRELIDAVTTAKISVTDIADNLVTNLSNRPLSAAQGVVLNEMIHENRTHYTEMVDGIMTVELDGTGPVIDAELCAKLYDRRDEAVVTIDGTEYRLGESAGSGETSWSYWVVDANGNGGNVIYCYTSGGNGIDAIAIRNNGTGAYIQATIKFPGLVEMVHRLDPKYLPELTMGIHTDGLLYLFVNGSPVGHGVQML